MEVHADPQPRGAVRGLHAVEQLDRRLLALDAVQAHVALELDGQSELRLEDRELVRERGREWGNLAGSVAGGCVHGGERWFHWEGVGHAEGAVDSDFTEHGGGERGETGTDIGKYVGE